MSVLVVGLSHRSAPVPLLEAVAAGVGEPVKMLHQLSLAPFVDEALLLSTCNRVEVYAEVSKFHAGVSEISDLLARTSGVALESLTPHLYVHYEDRTVQHLFAVACGLDSMVVGEAQVLGQLRGALQLAREEGTTGRSLDALVQTALRVGKRAHSETGIDRAGASLVEVGLAAAERALGGLAGRRALLVGAGSMAALSGAAVRRRGVTGLVVANRTVEHARRLAASLGAEPVGLSAVPTALAAADLLVTCTGATGVVVDAGLVAAAMAGRPDRPLHVLDLALPHDVDPAVRQLPGVSLVDLEDLGVALESEPAVREVEAVGRIVAEEVAAFHADQRAARVAPTVVALRSRAAEVVEAELGRLAGRLPDLDPRTRGEVASTVRRVVDKLLHAPTVRVKELAEAPGGESYAEALRELFDLDPSAPVAVTGVDPAVSPVLPGSSWPGLEDPR